MVTEIWLALIASLLTLIGAMFSIGYRDISRRLLKLEKQDSKLFAATMTILVSRDNDPKAIADAMHTLLIDGIERVS